MTISVRELVLLPDLGTWVHAGEAGLDREVGWAHVCELANPAEWLGPGDLLLSTGLGIPRVPAKQRAYLERLAAAKLAGIAIGHRMYAPPLSGAMTSAADELRFPLLLTSYEVPFSAVVRAVADANQSEEHARLLRVLGLYETISRTAVNASGAQLLRELERIVGCRLTLVDYQRGITLLTGSAEPLPGLAAAVQAASARRREPMPAVLRLEHAGRALLAIAIPASRPASLVVLPEENMQPDLSILRHLAAAVALEIERAISDRERRRHVGAELLTGLLDGTLAAEAASASLSEWELEREPRVLAVFPLLQADDRFVDLHARLEDRGVRHLLVHRGSHGFVLLRDDPDAIAALCAELPPGTPVGLSGRVGLLSRCPDAQREARWALDAAVEAGGLTRYGEAAASFFLPRVLGEADRAVRSLLGPLLDYDDSHKTELVRSLHVFLANDRSWKAAAAELHIHKQTLVYRIHRIEQLTGRRLDRMDDLAELWLALRAAQVSRSHTGVRTSSLAS